MLLLRPREHPILPKCQTWVSPTREGEKCQFRAGERSNIILLNNERNGAKAAFRTIKICLALFFCMHWLTYHCLWFWDNGLPINYQLKTPCLFSHVDDRIWSFNTINNHHNLPEPLLRSEPPSDMRHPRVIFSTFLDCQQMFLFPSFFLPFHCGLSRMAGIGRVRCVDTSLIWALWA